MISLPDAVQIATLIGVVVTVVTLIKGVLEFARQNALKRADYFFALVGRLSQDPVLKIVAMLDHPESALETVPFKRKNQLPRPFRGSGPFD